MGSAPLGTLWPERLLRSRTREEETNTRGTLSTVSNDPITCMSKGS